MTIDFGTVVRVQVKNIKARLTPVGATNASAVRSFLRVGSISADMIFQSLNSSLMGNTFR